MEINKAHWSTKDGGIRLSMPINKIDVERRIVSGFATLDNLDKQGDVVPADASLRAFESFRGNIREMHQPKAVGKVVSFREDSYFDPETQKFYNGIYVSAYVSKGAEDTWLKVTEKILTGFSIGGVVKESEDVYDEELGQAYQVIKDYELSELSLVDNPANQFANVLSIEKGELTGYLAKASFENVFWCRNDDVVKMSDESNANCPQCSKSMSNIGYVESNDPEKAVMVKAIVSDTKVQEIQNGITENSFVKFGDDYGKVSRVIFKGGARLSSEETPLLAKTTDPVTIIQVYSQIDGTIVPTSRRVIKSISSLEKVNAISKSEVKEVSKMDSEIVVVDDAVEDSAVQKSMTETVVEPAPQSAFPVEVDDVAVENDPVADAAEDAAEGEVEKAAKPDEEESADEAASETPADEEEEAKKAVEPEMTKVDAPAEFAKALDSINETLASALSTLAETVKALDAKIEGINKSVTGLGTEVNEVKDSFGKRVDAVEKDTAFRKSADLGEVLQEEPVIVEKSTWGGRFLNSADLF
jgi:hypothetical protein